MLTVGPPYKLNQVQKIIIPPCCEMRKLVGTRGRAGQRHGRPTVLLGSRTRRTSKTGSVDSGCAKSGQRGRSGGTRGRSSTSCPNWRRASSPPTAPKPTGLRTMTSMQVRSFSGPHNPCLNHVQQNHHI